jgi:prefoldin subunit 5
MNEEQEKIRKKLRKMNDLEDELEEVKREHIHVKKLLFEVEEEKESIKELL